METEHTELCGFILEGVRGGYSGNMSVPVCAVRFGRLVSARLPAKTHRQARWIIWTGTVLVRRTP